MKKHFKKVFSINLEPGYRNYTVKDLLDIKGKKKLTQILVSSPDEAAAAEEAGTTTPEPVDEVAPTPTEAKGYGTTITIIVILLVVVLLIVYYFMQKK